MSRLHQGLHRLRYFVTDAWDEWRHNPGVNLLAVATLGAALFLAGLVMLLIGNIQANVVHLRDNFAISWENISMTIIIGLKRSGPEVPEQLRANAHLWTKRKVRRAYDQWKDILAAADKKKETA